MITRGPTSRTLLLVGPQDGPVGVAGEQARRAGWSLRPVDNAFAAIEAVRDDAALEAALLDMEAFQPRVAAVLDTLLAVRPGLSVYLVCPAWMEPEARRLTRRQPDTDYLVEPISSSDLARLGGEPARVPARREHGEAAGPQAGQAADDAALPAASDSLLERVSGPIDSLLFAAARWASEALGGAAVEVRWRTKSARWPQERVEQTATAGQGRPQNEFSLSLPLAKGPGRGDQEAGQLLIAGQSKTAVRPRRVADMLSRLFVLNQRFARLQEMAFTDHLSGAYNRRYLMYFLDRLISRATRENFRITLLMFDIDDFKKYNDEYGHTVGDEIIAEISCLMRQTSREHDVVARIGGDEFVVLFWDAGPPRQPGSQHPTEAAAFAERFRKMLASHTFRSLGPEAQGTLTLSGGLAHFPADGVSAADLLARASECLKQAKRSGKDRIYVVGQQSV